MTYDPKKSKNTLPTSIEQSEVSKAVEKSYKKYANGFQRPSVLLSLEPRMMFDGAAPAVLDDIIESSNAGPSSESLPNPDTQAGSSQDDSSQPASDQSSSDATVGTPSAEDQSLFDQLTNNSSSALLSDLASGLDQEGTADDSLESEQLESTLDDLEDSSEQDLDGTAQSHQSQAVEAVEPATSLIQAGNQRVLIVIVMVLLTLKTSMMTTMA